jgi:predicted CXXCH cytochrome family protein
MKRINLYNKFIMCTLFVSIFVGIILSIYTAPTATATDDIVKPILHVISPLNNSYNKVHSIGFNGMAFDNETTNMELNLMAYFDSNPTGETISVNLDGKWSFVKEFTDGMHQVTFELKDKAGNIYIDTITIYVKFINPEHDVHGDYSMNTQSCSNCHSTHVASEKDILGGKALKLKPSNLCMACHDGTNGPKIEEFKTINSHKTLGEEAASCTSCHDPHIDWNPENTHRLKDEVCVVCPEQETNVIINTSHYRASVYNISDTQEGKVEDYSSFCFKCHNNETNGNIQQFYTTPSGHEIMDINGTRLAGFLCSDCHDNHGTNNIKQLKEKLGHVNRVDEFVTTSTEWTVLDERQFCLKCHNNTTEMYGKIATLFAKDSNGEDIVEHSPANETACSVCHGTGVDFIEQSRNAAHAPKKLTTSGP